MRKTLPGPGPARPGGGRRRRRRNKFSEFTGPGPATRPGAEIRRKRKPLTPTLIGPWRPCDSFPPIRNPWRAVATHFGKMLLMLSMVTLMLFFLLELPLQGLRAIQMAPCRIFASAGSRETSWRFSGPKWTPGQCPIELRAACKVLRNQTLAMLRPKTWLFLKPRLCFS